VLRNRKEFISGPSYALRAIVDRIGTGDAFAAGLIHGLTSFEGDAEALGVAAAVEVASGRLDPKVFEDLTARVMTEFPNLARVAVTLRESASADGNRWSAVLRNRKGFLSGLSFDIRAIVDRIGTGDAFAAGLIHGLTRFEGDAEALDFAVAAAALKHSIPGDFNLSTEKDILTVARGDRSGRVRR
jgi:2-dehydro-3-deoxygluconokinase